MDQAWREMEDADRTGPAFDIFYVSYKEARYGAPKELVSRKLFRPPSRAVSLKVVHPPFFGRMILCRPCLTGVGEWTT